MRPTDKKNRTSATQENIDKEQKHKQSETLLNIIKLLTNLNVTNLYFSKKQTIFIWENNFVFVDEFKKKTDLIIQFIQLIYPLI